MDNHLVVTQHLSDVCLTRGRRLSKGLELLPGFLMDIVLVDIVEGGILTRATAAKHHDVIADLQIRVSFVREMKCLH